MLRPHPKYSETNPDDPRAWGVCDRCGRTWNLHRLQWQFAYQGSSQLQNTRFLVCETCYDVPNPQLSPVILSPDPPPLFNTRPEAYALDETNWLTTQDGDIIDTELGEDLISTVPNPSGLAPDVADMTTESDDTIVTEDGNNLINDLPNPDINTVDPNPQNTELPP